MVLTPTQCNNHPIASENTFQGGLAGQLRNNYDRLPDQIDELIRIADTFDIPAIKAKLQEIVPEYTPQ